MARLELDETKAPRLDGPLGIPRQNITASERKPGTKGPVSSTPSSLVRRSVDVMYDAVLER